MATQEEIARAKAVALYGTNLDAQRVNISGRCDAVEKFFKTTKPTDDSIKEDVKAMHACIPLLKASVKKAEKTADLLADMPKKLNAATDFTQYKKDFLAASRPFGDLYMDASKYCTLYQQILDRKVLSDNFVKVFTGNAESAKMFAYTKQYKTYYDDFIKDFAKL